MTATTPTPRRKGDGSIRAFPGVREPERHQIRWRDLTGVRRTAYAPTADDAERMLRKVLHERDVGVPGVSGRHTLRTWLPVWLEGKSGDLRPRSGYRYARLADHWLADPIAARRLPEILPDHVTGSLARMARAGRSASVRASALSILRMALDSALRAGYVGRNVVRQVDAPRVEHRPVEPPRGADRRALQEQIRGDRLEALWTIALYAGLRQGEILALRWQDVEEVGGQTYITVRGTLEYGTDRIGRPKSLRGYRRLPVHTEVADALERHRERQPVTPHPTAWIFATATGRPLHARNVLGWWHELCARAGTRRYRMHDLRHAALTHLAETNDLLFVSRYGGHSSVKITGDLYAHNDLAGMRLEREA